MKITHLSSRDSSGGAARAAYRLHRGLRGIGEDSSMFVRWKSVEDEYVEDWNEDLSLLGKIRARIKRRWLSYRFRSYQSTRPQEYGIFSQARTVIGEQVVGSIPGADIYNMHWIRAFIDPLPFFRGIQQPVVWTLHDMNPFTGGCHVTAGCRRFEEVCGRCPQLGSNTEKDLSRNVWNRKRRAYQSAIRKNRLHVVAPSEWMAEEARASSLFSDTPVRVIPHGLDQATFQPRDTEGFGTTLGIPEGQYIVLFVAQSVQDQNKGLDLLMDALSSLTSKGVTLLSIGDAPPNWKTSHSHYHFGTINSNLLLSAFYSLADLFVIPSRQEAFGQTALESMACGTPVVGFDTGGIPDMVRSGETGWLAEVGNVRALREAIEQALSDDARRERMGKRCREVVEEEYTLEVQARRYRDLYADLIQKNSAS